MHSIPAAALGFVALALGALATGCQHVPPAPLSPEQGASRLEGRSLADPALRICLAERFGRPTDPWPRSEWSLEDLTRVAICQSTALTVARATVDVARAHERTVAQLPNPIFMAQPFYVSNNLASGLAPWTSQFNLSWLIETGGKRAHRRAAAEAGARVAEAGVVTTAWTIRGQVAQTAIALEAARERSASRAGIVEVLARRAELIEHRLERGYAAAGEVAVARRDLLQAQTQSATAERLESQARANLAASLGLPSEALATLALAEDFEEPAATWTRATTLDAATARHVAMIGRTDVLAALADYDAAEANLRLQLAHQYPNVTFGPAYKYDKSQNDYGLSLAVELPILSRNEGGIAEAVANRQLVAARFDALQSRILAEVDAAVQALDAARLESLRAKEMIEAAQQASDLAARQLASGALDRAALLAARLAFENVAIAGIDAREALQLALARLELAVQPSGPIADLLAAEEGP